MTLPRPSRKFTKQDRPVEKASKLDPSNFRPSDVFVFDPQMDITVFELADLIRRLYDPAIHFKSFLDLPDGVQRHFRPTKV